MPCKQCGKEYEAKRSTSQYCSPKCRYEFYRSRMSSNAKPVCNANAKNVTLKDNANFDLEQCRYCGVALPKLSQPRKYPGACYSCAIAQPSKPQLPATDGHTVSSTLITTRTHKLTVMERLFYRPASELKAGETNFVSLPGRACYGVY